MAKIIADGKWVRIGDERFSRRLFGGQTREETERRAWSLIRRCHRETASAVARDTGIYFRTLMDICRCAGKPLYPPFSGERGTAWRRDQCEQLFREGWSENEIAEHLGIDRPNVWRALNMRGLKGPQKGLDGAARQTEAKSIPGKHDLQDEDRLGQGGRTLCARGVEHVED